MVVSRCLGVCVGVSVSVLVVVVYGLQAHVSDPAPSRGRALLSVSDIRGHLPLPLMASLHTLTGHIYGYLPHRVKVP